MAEVATAAAVAPPTDGRATHRAGLLPPLPYPGIRPFEKAEWPIFCGRQRIVDELLENLGDARFLPVLGTSGCGKSSLIKAGLIATLEREHGRLGASWRTIEMRPANAPMWRLAEALWRATKAGGPADSSTPPPEQVAAVRALLGQGPGGIERVLKAHGFPDDHNLLLHVDQFEELFRFGALGGEAEAETFVDQLVDVFDGQPRSIYLVATMRTDFLGDCTRFQRLADAFNQTGYLLRRMTEAELREAIERPARLFRGRVEPKLVDRLIRDAGHEQDHLPLLEHALMWMWVQHDSKSVTLTLEDYLGAEVGGVEGALSLHADRIYDGLASDALRLVAKRLFQALSDVDRDGRVIRRPGPFGELCALIGAPPAEMTEVIDEFRKAGRSFLMPPLRRPLDDRTVIDVSHEALIRNWRRLRGWIDQDREFLRTKRRVEDAMKHWASEGREASLLLPRGRPLAEAQEILVQRRSDLPRDVTEFIEASIAAKLAQDEAEQKAHEERVEAERKIERQQLEVQRLEAEREAEHQQLERQRVEAGAAKDRETAAQRLAQRTRLAACGIGVLAVLAAGFGWYATRQANEAAAAREAAEAASRKVIAQAQIIESRRLKYASEQATASGDATVGILLALEALPDAGAHSSRPYMPEAEAALFYALYQRRELAVLRGHEGPVGWASFNAAQSRVVTASDDGTARLWETATGKELAVLRGHEGPVRSASFNADGSRVATASGDGTARLWDAATGKELAVLRGHADAVASASFSADGSQVVTASDDGTARLWEAASGKELAVLRGHEGAVRSASFSADGTLVATASDDHTARLWKVATGEPLAVLRGHNGPVRSASFNADGSQVATASDDYSARLWEVATGKELAVLQGHLDRVWSAAFSPDGSRVVTASTDGTARLWDAHTGQQVVALRGHVGGVGSAIFSADGTRVLTASEDSTARLWDAATGAELAALRGHEGPVRSAAFSADGGRVVTASQDGTARLWDFGSKELTVLRGHEGNVWSAAFSPDGNLAVTASDDGTARLWDAGSGKEVAVLRGHEDAVRSANFSADGTRVATASFDHTARLWDAATGKEVAVLRGHEDWVLSAMFSPDGTRVVTASSDKTARLWEASTGKELVVLTGHEGPVGSASFNADGSRVVTASDDGTARLWDALTGKELAVLRGHENEVWSAAFSADGSRVATASKDGTARLWDAYTAQEVAVLRGHEGPVGRAAFSTDGRRLVTASNDGTARLWDAATGKVVGVLRGHEGAVFYAALNRDGSRLVTASEDYTARIWRVFPTTESLIEYAKTIVPRSLTPEERQRYFLDAGATVP